MFAAAVLLPETALLLPGAAGSAEVLVAERAAAVAAVERVLLTGPDRVVVVTPTMPAGTVVDGTVRPTLAGSGIGDEWLGLPLGVEPGVALQDAAASVAVLVLRRAGWSGPLTVVGAGSPDGAALRGLGADLVAGQESVVLVLAGSLSARRGPDGPLADDERAAGLDDAVVAALVDLGPASVARLTAVPAALAQDLAVSAWAPWQVLLGAAPGGTRGTAVSVSAPFGATYAVITWMPPA
ncbi:MAG TPA: hypothetical protein VGK35_02230 [Actinotalea sp.]|jgi:hypothetical protein